MLPSLAPRLALLLPMGPARCSSPACLAHTQLIHGIFGEQAPAARFVAADAEALPAASHCDLTYGELDLEFFEELLALVRPRADEIFIDIGSGCGRLVCSAALQHEWRRAIGIEVVRGLHEEAIAMHLRVARAATEHGVPMRPCEFLCELGETAVPRLFASPDSEATGTATTCVVFVYATTWPCAPGFKLVGLSELLGTHLRRGSRVVVVGRRLVSEAPHGGWRFRAIGDWTWRSRTTGLAASAFAYELS